MRNNMKLMTFAPMRFDMCAVCQSSWFVRHSLTHSITNSLIQAPHSFIHWFIQSPGCRPLITALMKWSLPFFTDFFPVCLKGSPFADWQINTRCQTWAVWLLSPSVSYSAISVCWSQKLGLFTPHWARLWHSFMVQWSLPLKCGKGFEFGFGFRFGNCICHIITAHSKGLVLFINAPPSHRCRPFGHKLNCK